MNSYEAKNIADGLIAPPSLHFPNMCMHCYRGISFRSMAEPSPYHPDDMTVHKCEYHNCWVPADGICDDYTNNMQWKQENEITV